jgi:signal transduction histidine kinase/integral membrane sensor domain MASE1
VNTSARLSVAHLTTVAAMVAVSYLGGVVLGLALTFPGTTTSVLWPPNAILTAALLIVPPLQWPVCLLAALPVHVALELGEGWPPLLVWLLYLTNCSEAIVGAATIRLLDQSPPKFDRLRSVAVFLGAAGLLAPVLSSFADAAVVNWLRSEPYWSVWRTRVFANMLTELSIVPVVIVGLRALSSRHHRRWRIWEGCALFAALVVLANTVFGGMSLIGVPGLPRTPTVLLLPVFFWAAIRFGVGGVSASLLVAALVAYFDAVWWERPFQMLPPAESVMAVQMYLSIMGIPLMCVAGLLEERRQANADLARRLRFEALLADVSTALPQVSHHDLPLAFERCLARIGAYLRADAVILQPIAADGASVGAPQRWSRDGTLGDALVISGERLPWTYARVIAADATVISTAETADAAASVDRATLRALGIQSAVIVPFNSGGSVHGALMVARRRHRRWSERRIAQIRLLAEVLDNARARRLAELEVERTRQKLSQLAGKASMGELSASLAHQLNQPLAAILSNAQAATRTIDTGASSVTAVREILDEIVADDRRAAGVIASIHAMTTRPEAAPSSVDLNAVVRDVATLISSDTIIRNVSVSFRLSPARITVMVNAIDLQHAVLNVLHNALDAVCDCGMNDRRVEVSTTSHNGHAIINVRDHGRGFAAGTEGRVFEPFFTTKPGGVGMGLAIAKSVVRAHGGAITVASDPSGGAVVTIQLPLAQTAAVTPDGTIAPR